jgi:hypothetical protein
MTERRHLTIIDCIADANVFGEHFRSGTWAAWLVFLCALFALPMTPEQLAIYRRHTGRDLPPSQPLCEAWLVCGRRAGKSFVLAVVAVFLACFKDWRPFLGPGELATIMVIAEDRKQSRAIMRFIGGLLRGAPMLRRTIVNETAESFTLRNRVQIEVHAASFRSTRTRFVRRYSTNLPCGRPTSSRPNLTSRSSTRSAPAWRRFRRACCCAQARRTRSVVRCGRRTASISATPIAMY